MPWTDLSFSVGQILTAAQMNLLQANFTALADGDPGAPRIAREAMGPLGNGSTGTLYKIAEKAGPIITNSESAVRVFYWKIPIGGTFSIRFTLTAEAGTVYAQIYRNGTSVSTLYSAGSAGATYTSVISGWSEGDLMEFYAHTIAGVYDSILTDIHVGINSHMFTFMEPY